MISLGITEKQKGIYADQAIAYHIKNNENINDGGDQFYRLQSGGIHNKPG